MPLFDVGQALGYWFGLRRRHDMETGLFDVRVPIYKRSLADQGRWWTALLT